MAMHVPFVPSSAQLVGSLSGSTFGQLNQTISDALVALSCNMRILQLQNNELSGVIPHAMSDMTQLQTWDMGYNKLNGT
jgi:hypothetical protein